MNGFILTITFVLVHNHYNFACYSCSHSSCRRQRRVRDLVVAYAIDVNLEIRMSFNDSRIASCYSVITCHILQRVDTRTNRFRCTENHMLTVISVGFTIQSDFVTKICLGFVGISFALIMRRHELVVMPWSHNIVRCRVDQQS